MRLRLTLRQSRVITLVGQGYNTKEIADKLLITPGTVKRHISNVCKLLKVNNRVQAVRMSCRLGLIPFVTEHDRESAALSGTEDPRIKQLEAEVARLRGALTPSAETKRAYIGEFVFDGPEGMVQVPWATIKEVMETILNFAALSPERTGQETVAGAGGGS